MVVPYDPVKNSLTKLQDSLFLPETGYYVTTFPIYVDYNKLADGLYLLRAGHEAGEIFFTFDPVSQASAKDPPAAPPDLFSIRKPPGGLPGGKGDIVC